MAESFSNYTHSILERLDASIQQLKTTTEALESIDPNPNIRKARGILTQTSKDIQTIRDEAQNTLTRLNTFGATLETLANPDSGIEVAVGDVFRWFLLLTECERAYISLYDKETDAFVIQVEQAWHESEIQPIDEVVSDNLIKKVIEIRDMFTSSNMDMASDSYHKSGSWRIPLRTVFGIPLMVGDELIGIFYGDKKITSGIVQRDMMPLFKLYAAEAAIAVRNAVLFAEIKQQIESLTKTNP